MISKHHHDTRQTAADWIMRENAGLMTPEAAAARDQWLAEHPDHVVAYDIGRQRMARFDAMAADPRILALSASALASRPGRITNSAWRAAAAFAAVAVFAGAGLSAVPRDLLTTPLAATVEQIVHPGAPIYRTAVGERSTVTLPDGSVVTLNTDTVLRVAFTDQARGVRLVRGQALFEVAHGKRTPFEVYAGDRVVTAVGTIFDVRIQGQAVKVALVEGRVRVSGQAPAAASGPRPEVSMAPGELLEARRAQPMRIQNIDVARETSWRSGMVVFDETPLGDAVAELNRYSRQQLVLEDQSIAEFHVTGGFKTGDMDKFARVVEDILPVDRVTTPDGTIRLSARAKQENGS
ncbi:MAG: FecR family protein [Parcubacteria group bacterium]